MKKRIYDIINKKDLRKLRDLALKEHHAFFDRNPHLKKPYLNSLIGICLCQGAAGHYLDQKIGIKDFDIWHFYKESNHDAFPYRFRKVNKIGYKNKWIDYLKRAISKSVCKEFPSAPDKIILQYLLRKNTKTKKLLLQQPIIGLYPESIFSKIIRRGENAAGGCLR